MNIRAMIACMWESGLQRSLLKTAAEPKRRSHSRKIDRPARPVAEAWFRQGMAACLVATLATNLASAPAQAGTAPTTGDEAPQATGSDSGIEEVRRHFERGQALFEQEEYREAEKSFHRALKAADQLGNPTMRHALLANLGMTHSAHAEQLGHSQERTDELNHAIAFYEQIISEEANLPQHSCEAVSAAELELEELRAQLGRGSPGKPEDTSTDATKVPEPRLTQMPPQPTDTAVPRPVERRQPRRLPKLRVASLSLGITGAVLTVAAAASLAGGLIYLGRAESAAKDTLENGVEFKLGKHTRIPPVNEDQESRWRDFIEHEIPLARRHWRASTLPIIGTGLALWLTGILLKPRAKSARARKRGRSGQVGRRFRPGIHYGRRELGLHLIF